MKDSVTPGGAATSNSRDLLREAVRKTVGTMSTDSAIDVVAIAENASRAYWAARLGGGSREEAEAAAGQTASDREDTGVMLRYVAANLDNDPRRSLIADIGLGALLPAFVLAAAYFFYVQFGFLAAATTLLAATFLDAILATTLVGRLVIFDPLAKRPASSNATTRWLEWPPLLQSAGAAFVGIAFLLIGAYSLRQMENGESAARLAHFDKTASRAVALSESNADTTQLRRILTSLSEKQPIQLQGVGPKVVLATDLGEDVAVARFGSNSNTGQRDVAATLSIQNAGNERAYSAYYLGQVERSQIGYVRLILPSGRRRDLTVADEVLPPEPGEYVVVSMRMGTGIVYEIERVSALQSAVNYKNVSGPPRR